MQRISVGDEVVIVRGNDKGKRGKVTRVLHERGAVIVEGAHQVKRHLRATPQRGGGILEVEAPIPLSRVMPVDPTTGKATRVKYSMKGDKKVRLAKSGAEISEAKQR
ncbi:MAG TPA: 50S ribosomal protein L24 [Polyangiaceae bacterium]